MFSMLFIPPISTSLFYKSSISSSSYTAMKQSFHVFLIFLFCALLLFSYSISARSLPQKQGEKKLKADGVTISITFNEMKEDVMELMGSETEDCDEKDEECLKRRMIAEAHLDYIYTQHKQP